MHVLQSRLSSLSNLGSVKLFVLSDLEKVLSNLDPGGSVRIRGVLSNFLFCQTWKMCSQTWIRGVLSGSGGFCQNPGCSVKSAVRLDPGGSVSGSGGFCQTEVCCQNMDPGRIRGVLFCQKCCQTDPGGSVRIRGVLSDWNVLSEWIRGVLSESPNFYTSDRVMKKM